MLNQKQKCHYLVYKAVKLGKIIRPNLCGACKRRRRIVAHHEDYSKPLDVIWLCDCCHNNLHKGRGLDSYSLDASCFEVNQENLGKFNLTGRSKEIINIMLSGAIKDNDIATRLKPPCKPGTVGGNIGLICAKLGLNHMKRPRVELLKWANNHPQELLEDEKEHEHEL